MNNPYTVSKEDINSWNVVKVIFKSVWFEFKWLVIIFCILAATTGVLLTVAPKILQQVIDWIVQGRVLMLIF